MGSDSHGRTGFFLPVLILAALTGPALVSGAGDDQPSVGNNVLFLHYDPARGTGSQFFMNANSTTFTPEYVCNVSAEGNLNFNFTLRPPLARELFPTHDGDNVLIRIHLRAESSSHSPLQHVRIALRIGESQMHTDGPDTSEPDFFIYNCFYGVNRISPGTPISVEVSLTAGAQAGVRLFTDGTSNVTLKLGESSDIPTGVITHDPSPGINWEAVLILFFIVAMIAIVSAIFLWPADRREE